MRTCPTCGGAYPEDQAVCPKDRTPLGARSRAGQRLDQRYLLQKPLPARGVGEHYLAQDLTCDREVSVRIVYDQLPGAEPAHDWLRRHPALAALHDQHLVAIRDWGVTADQASYYVSDPLHHPTLHELLRGAAPEPGTPRPRPGTHQGLDLMHACDVAIQLAEGLAALHAIGLVYDHLQPRHVVLGPPPVCDDNAALARVGAVGQARLLDFGNARRSGLLSPGQRAGSIGHPEYLAPERIQGEPSSPHSDQYSLGCLLFELVAGQVPFRGQDRHETLWLQQHGDLSLPPRGVRGQELPAALAFALRRLLCKQPERRYPSMQTAAQELTRVFLHLAALRGLGRLPEAPLPRTQAPPRPRLSLAWVQQQQRELADTSDPRTALSRAQALRARLCGPGAPETDRAACLLLVGDAYRRVHEQREAQLLYQEALRLLPARDDDAVTTELRELCLRSLQALLRGPAPRGGPLN